MKILYVNSEFGEEEARRRGVVVGFDHRRISSTMYSLSSLSFHDVICLTFHHHQFTIYSLSHTSLPPPPSFDDENQQPSHNLPSHDYPQFSHTPLVPYTLLKKQVYDFMNSSHHLPSHLIICYLPS